MCAIDPNVFREMLLEHLAVPQKILTIFREVKIIESAHSVLTGFRIPLIKLHVRLINLFSVYLINRHTDKFFKGSGFVFRVPCLGQTSGLFLILTINFTDDETRNGSTFALGKIV